MSKSFKKVVLSSTNTLLNIKSNTGNSESTHSYFLNRRAAPHTITGRIIPNLHKVENIICITITYTGK